MYLQCRDDIAVHVNGVIVVPFGNCSFWNYAVYFGQQIFIRVTDGEVV